MVVSQSPKHKKCCCVLEELRCLLNWVTYSEGDLWGLLTSTRLQMNKRNWPALFEIYPNLFHSSGKHEIDLYIIYRSQIICSLSIVIEHLLCETHQVVTLENKTT